MSPSLKAPGVKGLLVALLPGIMLAGGTALADEVSGSVDGEARQWHVLRGEDGKTASYSEVSPGIHTVTVQAHRQNRYEVEGSVSVTFTLMDDEILDAQAIYFPQARMTPNYIDENAQGGLMLEHVDLGGATARLTGRYEGELAYKSSMFSEPDPANTISLVVEFNISPSRED